MNRWVLIEDDIPAFDLSGTRVVALSPWAAASLKARGQSYFILEDYYSEKEMRAGEDLFFEEQLAWLAGFDTFLQERIPKASDKRWPLASVHCNRFKYLIDSFLIRGYAVSEFFKKAKPAEVTLVQAPVSNEPAASIYEFNRRDRWSYAPFLERAAREHGSAFKTADAKVKDLSKPSGAELCGLPFRAAAKKIRNFFYYQKWKSSAAQKPLNLLLLDAGVAAFDDLTRKLIHEGHRVFIKDKNRISAVHNFFEPEIDLGKTGEAFDSEALAREFFESPLWRSLERRGPISFRHLIQPYFEDFFRTQLPRVIKDAAALSSFYNDHAIDGVIARAGVGENYPAALIAAGASQVPRICLQHSTGPGDLKDWAFDELAFFDINFAVSGPSADYFKSRAKEKYPHCKVFESSQYLSELRKKIHPASSGSRPVILYCPAKLAKGMSHFNTMFYPMSWYFEHQIKMISHLASVGDYEILYKHTEGQGWADRSILPWLEQQNFPNVKVCKGRFTDFLPQASRVFLDYPSTGLFETSACGIPVLALYHEAMTIWPPMLDLFGKSLQKFSTADEAISRLNVFLNAPDPDYQVRLALNDAKPEDLIGPLLLNKERFHVEA